MIVNYKNKKINITVKKLSYFGKFSGLMFKSRKTQNLLFEFNRKTKMAIHSFFVFFDFLAVWLDDKNNVIEFKIIKPFNPYIAPQNKFMRLIEIPINEKNKKIIEFFVGKGKI